SFLRTSRGGLFTRRTRKFFTQRGKTQAALHQDFRSEALFFAQDPEQQMLGPNVFHPETLRLFTRHIEDTLALGAQWNLHRRRDALADSDARFNFLPD